MTMTTTQTNSQTLLEQKYEQAAFAYETARSELQHAEPVRETNKAVIAELGKERADYEAARRQFSDALRSFVVASRVKTRCAEALTAG